jgi:hypothetical protein
MYLKIIVPVAKMCLKMDGTWQILGFSHFCLFKEFARSWALSVLGGIVSKKKNYIYLFVTLLKLNTKT